MTAENYQVTDAFNIVHPITLVQGKNAEVWDKAGKRYIDFIGGIGVLNFGHGHPHILAAIHAQADKLVHYAYNAAGHQPYQELLLNVLLKNCVQIAKKHISRQSKKQEKYLQIL